MFELYCRALVIPTAPLNPAKVVAEIRALEGIGQPMGTKGEEPFKKGALRGLFKKHYLEDGLNSMRANIVLGLGPKQKELPKIIKTLVPTIAHLPPREFCAEIANAVTNVYADRARRQKLTGEWLVFAKHEGKNYYLSLATHHEEEDEVCERIKLGCLNEFPFLF